jgi:D-galactarolactone cycloisomerase
MQIKAVETYPLFWRLSETYGDANGWKNYRASMWFRICTASGLTGWGECTDWLPTLVKGFEERVIPYLLGKSCLNRGELVATVRKWHPRIAAGLSMALTEIVAKRAGLSVCDLWGGRRRNEVPVYASFQSYTDRPDWIDRSVHMVKQAVDESGFGLVKVKVGGKPIKEDQQHIAALISTLRGAVKWAVDANQSYDLAAACQWIKVFSESDHWLWFEEPLPLDSVAAYRMLRSRCQIPIAGGENGSKPQRFLYWWQQGALDVIQPDPAHMGGVENFLDTIRMARHLGVRVSPHAFDGILSRLYAVLAQSCLPPWSKMAGEGVEPVEWDAMENPLSNLLPVQPVGGRVRIPDGPGIGVEIEPRSLQQYVWDGTIYH